MDAAGEEGAPLRSRPLLHYRELALGAPNKKIRLTSVDASENFLACGANNGSVFLYATSVNRAEVADTTRALPFKYHLVKTIAPHGNSDRAGVSCITICPQQKRLVVGTVGGVVYGLQLTEYNKIGERVEFTHDFHAGFPVTCFLWDKLGMKLYSACNGGMVAQTTLRAGMSAFFGKADTELLLKEETGIVQLDMTKYGRADILLVSSQVRVLLLNLSAADGSAVQIGTKARQGNFGACFVTSPGDEVEVAKNTNVKVFSSRPGRRVWVADPQTGTVSATLKFSLGKTPTTFRQSPGCLSDDAVQSRDLTINKLALFQFLYDPFTTENGNDRSLLVSWNTGSSALFFLDPVAVEIVEWHLDMGILHDVKVLTESVLVVLHGDPPKVSVIQSCSPRQFIDIYAQGDVRKSVELAIEYRMNDASLLQTLKTQWMSMNETSQDLAVKQLSSELESLYASAKDLEERNRAQEPNSPIVSAAAPLQVIFKQRPQQQQQQSAASTPSSFASTDTGLSKADTPRPGEFLDLRPSPLAYRRNIFAPDGSTLEAHMVDIKELSASEPIVRSDYRESWMEAINEEVRKFEAYKAENEGAMNMLPTLRGTLNNTGAAAKVISGYIPGANMISNLMDTAAHGNYVGRSSAMNIFGDLPAADETLILDPIELKKSNATRDEAHECAVLRIAMSATGDNDSSVDTEVLLEAISMDIWDSKLKYISNLPLNKQLSLPDATTDDDEKNPISPQVDQRVKKNALESASVTIDRPSSAEKKSPFRKSKSAESLAMDIPSLSLMSGESSLQTTSRRILNRRNSLSPDTGRSAQRALQRHIGGGPTCDFQRKCLVSGLLASVPELDSILKREVGDLMAELQSAATTAEKSARLIQRLWPAAGVTRICGCLTNMFLLEGDLKQAQTAIRWWLACFDPSAKPNDPLRSPTESIIKDSPKSSKIESKTPTFTKGEALIDGDGLPLTRSDWTLVRVMVSTYFAICAAGEALQIRPAKPADLSSEINRPYAFEIGIVLELGHSEVRSRGAQDESWAAKEAEAFVKKYGIYLNTELAAEICNKRQMGTALNSVLDQVVSSSNMSSTCDDVVNWIVEKQVGKALDCLRDMDSLCLLLHVLDLLLKKCPDEAIEFCVTKYPSLTPWNLERCLFGARPSSLMSIEDFLRPENVAQTATYYRYLIRLLDINEQAGQESVLVNRCLQLCFGGTKVIGKTFVGGHSDAIKWFCSIIKQPGRFNYEHDIAWQLCIKNHVNVGLVELTCLALAESPQSSHSTDELDHLVQLILKKKELVLLDELLARVATIREDVASNVVEKILGCIEATAGRGDDELITTAVHTVVNSIGPSEGMKRLARYPLLFAASPLSMYQTIVEAHLLTQRQDEEVNLMLETMDTHVWAAYKQASSNTGVSFASQLEAVFDLERGALRVPLDDAKFAKWQAKRSKYEGELEQDRLYRSRDIAASTASLSFWETQVGASRHQVSRCFETRSSDWGGEVQLHDATCSVCDLPVVIIADDNCNMEVALLPCGHAFHSVCANDSSCPVCFDSCLESLTTGTW